MASDPGAPWFRPFLETANKDRILLPSRRSLNAALRSLKPSDGIRLSIKYEGTDNEGEETYIVRVDGDSGRG